MADDDKPGYGKPPKEYRFKPGQPGNPKGRKKGSRGLKTDLKAELHSKVTITENGKTFSLTKQQIIIKSLATKAAKGDVKAANSIVALTIQMFGIDDERSGKTQLSASDQVLLDDYLSNNAGVNEPPPGWQDQTPKPDVTDPIMASDDDHPETDEDSLSELEPDEDDELGGDLDDDDYDPEFDDDDY